MLRLEKQVGDEQQLLELVLILTRLMWCQFLPLVEVAFVVVVGALVVGAFVVRALVERAFVEEAFEIVGVVVVVN